MLKGNITYNFKQLSHRLYKIRHIFRPRIILKWNSQKWNYEVFVAIIDLVKIC